MLRNKFNHLEHRNNRFSFENFFQVSVGINIASVLFVLKAVLFDVHPEFFDNLGTGHWPLTDDCSQVLADFHRLHKRRIRFCHIVFKNCYRDLFCLLVNYARFYLFRTYLSCVPRSRTGVFKRNLELSRGVSPTRLGQIIYVIKIVLNILTSPIGKNKSISIIQS